MDEGIRPPQGPTASYLGGKGSKEYRVNLAVKTILFTLLAILCVILILKVSSSKGDVNEGGLQDENKSRHKNANDDDKGMAKELDEEEGHSRDEIDGAPTFEIDSDDE